MNSSVLQNGAYEGTVISHVRFHTTVLFARDFKWILGGRTQVCEQTRTTTNLLEAFCPTSLAYKAYL